MLTAKESLDRLRDGNRRFVRSLKDKAESPSARSLPSVKSQSPFAIIVGCSDSRVPAEIVFDQGLGDLFVIRVAGNIVAPSQVGSIEFAVANFGTPLVVVLGHTHCSAVAATLDHLKNTQNGEISRGLQAIIEHIAPAVERLADDDADAVGAAVRMNVHASVAQLVNESTVLQRLVAEGSLKIVGAEYSLETGIVDFL